MYKIKKYLLPITFVIFTITLILFSKSNILAVKAGLNLWVNNIVPSLFPFFIAVMTIIARRGASFRMNVRVRRRKTQDFI